jgi:3-hydroxymyristoyl/3-hydroxydecanoyl-(acyl carrier protein) dehydratase
MNLPSILAERRNGDDVVLDLALTEDLDVFRGHFPSMPVLPGVAQIDWALRLAKRQGLIGLETELWDFQVKFRSVIRPAIPLTLTLQWDRDRRRINFDYRSGHALMSSGRLNIQAESS